MSEITLEEVTKTLVKLDGKVVGEIKVVLMPNCTMRYGYQYFPKGSKKGGSIFSLKSDLLKSLNE